MSRLWCLCVKTSTEGFKKKMHVDIMSVVNNLFVAFIIGIMHIINSLD